MTVVRPPRHLLVPVRRPVPGQALARAIALPPPPGKVPSWHETEFSDAAAFHQAQEQYRNPDPLVNSLIQAARRLNITAAPPAHIKPHIWSEPVDISAQVTMPGANPGAYQTVCTFTTPPGRWARIEHYGVNVVTPSTYAYDGELLWAFKLNGRFLDQGMSDWGEQRGSMVFMRQTVILMNNEGVTLEFLIRRAVANAVPKVVQMAFRGWTYRLRNNYEGTQGSVTAY
jgi:hypothetical protein